MEKLCLRCGHGWNPRKPKKPTICPKCKSPYWDKPRKKITKEFIIKTIKLVINLHNTIIIKSGGEKGIRDQGGLYNGVSRILEFQNKNESKPFDVAAFVYQDLAKRHHFFDGNKRTAHCFAKIILMTMNYHLKIRYPKATEFIIAIARDKNAKSFNEIKAWIRRNAEKIKQKEMERYLYELHYDITNEQKED